MGSCESCGSMLMRPYPSCGEKHFLSILPSPSTKEVCVRCWWVEYLRPNVASQSDVYEAIRAERARQDEQWGGPDHDDDHGGEDWIEFINRFLNKALPYTMIADEWYDGILKATALGVAALEARERDWGIPDG